MIPYRKYDQILSQITAMHNCATKFQFDRLLEETLAAWKSDPELLEFQDYFVKRWIESSYNKWQQFQSPAGLSHTNAPLEEYETLIKEAFLNRLRHHVKSSIKIWQTFIK